MDSWSELNLMNIGSDMISYQYDDNGIRTSKMVSGVTNTYTTIEKLYIPYIDIACLFLAADGFVLSKFDKGKGVTFRFNAFFGLPGVMTGIWG